ncbi:MAG: hypothetical protein HW378_3724 [Anaerolineales bacterium]|nr:hypothetical protein [Anaerolineales bacterium]
MPDENLTALEPSSSDQSSSIAVSAKGDITVGGDMVGGDKITTITQNYYVVGKVADGLQALNGLIQQNDDLRAGLRSLRDQFHDVSRQIDQLSNYKAMHDLLHQLEFECYKVLVQTTPKFPADRLARREVRQYRIKLERLLADLREAAQRAVDPDFEQQWIADLAGLPGQLDHALEADDRDRLEEAIQQLKMELDVQPARINNELVGAAGALRLPDLAQALAEIRTKLLEAPGLDPARVQVFQTGVNELARLSAALTALVRDHNGWQDVEVRLRRIEALVLVDAHASQDLRELKRAWPKLKEKSQGLSQSRADGFSEAFQAASAALDAQLATAPPDVLSELFLDYRAYAGELFVQVDVDLRNLCGDLRIIGEKLAETLRMLE